MPHCDPDLLALLALGEDAGSAEDRHHLDRCDVCRQTLDELRAVVTVARDVRPADRPEAPPPHLWAGVRAELGLTGPDPLAGTEAAASREATTSSAEAAAMTQAAPSTQAATSSAPPPPATPPTPPPATAPLAEARARRRGWQRPALLVAAAAAGVAVGVAGTLLVVDTTPDAGTQVVTVATTDLAPLPDWDAAGTATVVRTPSGERLLEVALSPAQPADGFREVWLIDRDVTRLVSLGVLDGATGTFAIPDGVDLAAYPVVDVSLEPLDGDPAHSGDSIVRGVLDA